jgi:hypothetical protein
VDPALGVCACFVSAPRRHVIYAKVILESYEGVGIARSVEPFYEGDRTLMVFLLAPDFLRVAQEMLAHLQSAIDLRFERASAERLAVLSADLLDELTRD